MQLRLTSAAAVQMLDAWARFLETNPGARALEDGTIKLDSAPQASPYVPRGDGSTIVAWYRASGPSTEAAVREAHMATQVLGLPRSLYVGKLIDIKRGRDGTVYLKCRTITRQDEAGRPCFRTLNPSKGEMVELLINPTPGDFSAAMTTTETSPQA